MGKLSEISVEFHGEGAGTGELTWGQLEIWLATQRTGQTLNLSLMMPLPGGTPLAELTGMLRFLVSRHPGLRTRLRFSAGPSGDRHPRQAVAASGEVPLRIAGIGDGDDPAAAAEELRLHWELAWFDYENEFPVRMGVIRSQEALTHLVVCYSHLMVDGGALNAIDEDLRHLDRATGEATAPLRPANRRPQAEECPECRKQHSPVPIFELLSKVPPTQRMSHDSLALGGSRNVCLEHGRTSGSCDHPAHVTAPPVGTHRPCHPAPVIARTNSSS